MLLQVRRDAGTGRLQQLNEEVSDTRLSVYCTNPGLLQIPESLWFLKSPFPCLETPGIWSRYLKVLEIGQAVLSSFQCCVLLTYDTIRYEMLFSRADMSQLNLPHGNNN